MKTAIDNLKERLDQDREKLQRKRKIVKERERRLRARQSAHIGKLARQANIDHIEDQILLGAFLDIKSRAQDDAELRCWKDLALAHQKRSREPVSIPLIVSFRKDPPAEVKQKLRELNLRWNKFRREYQGYQEEKKLKEVLDGTDYELERAE